MNKIVFLPLCNYHFTALKELGLQRILNVINQHNNTITGPMGSSEQTYQVTSFYLKVYPFIFMSESLTCYNAILG